MTSAAKTLVAILDHQGRQVRAGQAAAAAEIDGPNKHVALMAPTGVGKSALAVAAAVKAGRATIAMHSNGLIAQYAAEIPDWEAATGATITTLVGKAHYWCPQADPSLAGFTEAQREHVVSTGSFVGSGVEQSVYVRSSVVGVSPDSDDDDDAVDPCSECRFKEAGCPLWAARNAAAAADVVVTNATMAGLAIGAAGSTSWLGRVPTGTVILDEAHADIEPLQVALGHQVTIKPRLRGVTEADAADAAESKQAAMALLAEWAADEDHRMARHAKRFLAAAKGALVLFDTDGRKTVLSIAADLEAAFAGRNVVAMSGTLSEGNVKELGLATKLVKLEGLDVSASRVITHKDAPAWAWAGGSAAQRAQHGKWADYTAELVAEQFRSGGATMALFVSRQDMDEVLARLPKDVARAALKYVSGVDRAKAIATYKANPKAHLIVGCNAGAGTGVDLPGELLRRVVLTRIPQNAPKGADARKWSEESRSAAVQSVGRAHRFDGDWGHVHVVGGFGHRTDIVENLEELGWQIEK